MVREYAWRHSVRRTGHVLHDEGRIANNGMVYSLQWLDLTDEAGRAIRDKSASGDFLAAAYFEYIRLRFHGLVRIGQHGRSIEITLLGMPLLQLIANVPARQLDRVSVVYTIVGGLLAVHDEAEAGRLIVHLWHQPEGTSRLSVEVCDYPARLLRLGPASLIYRLTQVKIHRWITFGYLLWCAGQRPQGNSGRARP